MDRQQAFATDRRPCSAGRELATSADVPASFTVGVLYAAERERVAATRRRFATLWPKVSRRMWHRWLTR